MRIRHYSGDSDETILITNEGQAEDEIDAHIVDSDALETERRRDGSLDNRSTRSLEKHTVGDQRYHPENKKRRN